MKEERKMEKERLVVFGWLVGCCDGDDEDACEITNHKGKGKGKESE